MFEKLKANILFNKLLKRPDINKAYKMVPPTDSWYETICKVHNSLAEIKKLPSQELEIVSHDNLKLKGLYYKGTSDVTIVCCHGYTSHAEREWAFPGLFYLSLGYNVLIPYQRAHGPSEGKRITFGVFEHLDMMLWINEVNKINPNGKVIIHGLSMGGGIALILSDKEMDNVKGIIADAPSTGFNDFVTNISNYVFKQDGERVKNKVIEKFIKIYNVDPTPHNIFTCVEQSKYPLLLSAGSNEGLDKLFERLEELNPNSTDTIILPGCNHGNGMYKQTKLYQDKIKKFISKVIK